MSLNLINSGLSTYINNSTFDIINFHWINCETISLSEIRKINKPLFGLFMIWGLFQVFIIMI